MHVKSGKWYTRMIGRGLALLLGMLVAVSAVFASAAPTVQAASGPQSTKPDNAPQTDGGGIRGFDPRMAQDPKWVALKLAGKVVRTGGAPNPAKGQGDSSTGPARRGGPIPYSCTTIGCGGGGGGGCTNCASLSINNFVPNSFEPSGGYQPYSCTHYGTNCRSNFTGLSQNLDDDNWNAYNDPRFFDLCGPGAADIALWWWPWPPNGDGGSWNEYAYGANWTTWNYNDIDSVRRARGYMMELAYVIQPPSGTPGWYRPGINMQQPDWNNVPTPTDRGTGATLAVMRDGLNWEASGHGSLGNWSTYFYYDTYSNGYNQGSLHNDVVSDINAGHAVVLLVNTNGLQNWGFSGNVWHFVTIIGYNDDNPGGPAYMYTDTCAQLTGCGSNTNGGVQIGKQSDLYNNSSGWDW